MKKRSKSKTGFTTIANDVFRDRTLSLQAKGLLCLLMSLPDDWAFSASGLTQLSTNGLDSTKKTLRELVSAGYLTRERTRNDNNAYTGSVYTISDYRQTEDEGATGGKATGGKASEGFPSEGKSTDILNTNILNTNKLKEELINKKDSKEDVDDSDDDFEEFWNAYPGPRKYDKPKCRAKYKFLHSRHADIMKGLEQWKQSIDWTKDNGRFIPAPERFLNAEYWTSTPITSTLQKTGNDEFDRFFEAYPRKRNEDVTEALRIWNEHKDDVKHFPESVAKALEEDINSAKWQEDNGKYIPNIIKWMTLGRWNSTQYKTPEEEQQDVNELMSLNAELGL